MNCVIYFFVCFSFDSSEEEDYLNNSGSQKELNTSGGSNNSDLRDYASVQFLRNAHEQLGR